MSVGDQAGSAARFPLVAASAGFYESYYLKATAPAGGQAIWIRYTVHKRPQAALKSFLWFTLFDTESGVVATKMQGDPPQVNPGTARASSFLTTGRSSIGPGHLNGEITVAEIAGEAQAIAPPAAWEVGFSTEEAPVWHLPWRWMYRARFPRTKALSLYPEVRLEGHVECGRQRVDVSGWTGTIGHNWGSEHARRAIWIHAGGLDGRRGNWIDLVLARIGVGAHSTPWIANGFLSLDGRRQRIGGLHRIPFCHVNEQPEHCHFSLTGSQVGIEGTVGADRKHFVGWLYAQPDGSERQTVNCSIADMALTVCRRGEPPRKLALTGAAAYELQMSERCPEIAVQPFGDG